VVRMVPDLWLAAALSVGVTIFVMFLTRSLHPPGGATSLVPALGGVPVQSLGYSFLWTPVLINVFLMLLWALLLNTLSGRRWPTRQSSSKPATADPKPLERLGIQRDDIRTALVEQGEFVDVSEADLGRLYESAAVFAYRRQFGELTVAHIMSRDLLRFEFATGLEEAWNVMLERGVKAFPVVDRGGHVIGILTQDDFVRHAGRGEYRSFTARLKGLIRYVPSPVSAKPEVVGQIMSMQPVTIPESAHVAELVPFMSDGGLHHMPVVDERRKLVGMVTQSDLVGALYRGGADGVSEDENRPVSGASSAGEMFKG
jgi:CBS domain-containing membrane protein